MPLSDDVMSGDQSATTFADNEQQFPVQYSSENTANSLPIPPPEPSEPEQYNRLAGTDRSHLKKAEDAVLKRHVNGEIIGVGIGLLACAIIRQRYNIGPFAVRDMVMKRGQLKPPFVKYWSTDYPTVGAAGLVAGRLTVEKQGWKDGDDILTGDGQAAERIRNAFGTKDSRDTVRTYRMAKSECQGLPRWLARPLYHLQYLSP